MKEKKHHRYMKMLVLRLINESNIAQNKNIKVVIRQAWTNCAPGPLRRARFFGRAHFAL